MAFGEGVIGTSGAETPGAIGMDEDPASVIATMAGLWTLRFGTFGCRDDETDGGILHVEGDRMAGDDGHCLYHGHYQLTDDMLTASLEVVCHGERSQLQRLFGGNEPKTRLDFTAVAIMPGHFEGCIAHGVGAGTRIVMRRLSSGAGATSA